MSHIPVKVDFDGESQGAKKSHISAISTEQIISNQPCLRTFLKRLQTLLDKLDLNWIARIFWTVQLRDKLDGLVFNVTRIKN